MDRADSKFIFLPELEIPHLLMKTYEQGVYPRREWDIKDVKTPQEGI